jgi:hypothetical protein
MIRFDIHSLEQLLQGRHRRTVFGDEKIVSVTLYEEILALPDAEALSERILLHFPDGRGAYRRTYTRRFEAFDAGVLAALAEAGLHGAEGAPLIVHDVGVSDARTSCDFFGKMLEREPHLVFHATDFDPEVFVIASGRTRVAIDAAQRLLEIVWPPFVFTVLNNGRLIQHARYYLYPVNLVVMFFVERLVARPMLALHRAGRLEARPLTLFSPRARALARAEPRFRLGKQDIREPFREPGRAALLRAMNVLNRSYFPEAEFRSILGNFHAALRPGGLLVTGSNQASGSQVDGGIYRRTEAGFSPVRQSGGGSPIHGLIEAFAP